MTRALNLVGKQFGRLYVIERAIANKGKSKWKCLCSCGKETIVIGSKLASGATKSCGCITVERIGNLNRTHSMSNSREWNSWRGMKERCDNPKNSHYHLYGQRGITYDVSWASFNNFFSDMGECPDEYQLDRIDVNLGYCKENCRWVDKTIQAYNIRLKRNNKTGRSGVTQKANGKYYAIITVYKKVIFLGVFSTFVDACSAREHAEIEYYGVAKK